MQTNEVDSVVDKLLTEHHGLLLESMCATSILSRSCMIEAEKSLNKDYLKLDRQTDHVLELLKHVRTTKSHCEFEQ